LSVDPVLPEYRSDFGGLVHSAVRVTEFRGTQSEFPKPRRSQRVLATGARFSVRIFPWPRPVTGVIFLHSVLKTSDIQIA
jgi:hypothetical protein